MGNYKLKFTDELYKQVEKYCLISARELLGDDKSSRRALYIAEESVYLVLMQLHRMNERGDFTEKKHTDNYLFVACKNKVRTTLEKMNALKRQTFNDYNNISLDKTQINHDCDYELKAEPNTTLKDTLIDGDYDYDYHEYITDKLTLIVDVLNKSSYIRDEDIDIFFKCFVDGMSYKDYSRQSKINYTKVLNTASRIKNVIKFFEEHKNKL